MFRRKISTNDLQLVDMLAKHQRRSYFARRIDRMSSCICETSGQGFGSVGDLRRAEPVFFCIGEESLGEKILQGVNDVCKWWR
jgi:hypothetical protein